MIRTSLQERSARGRAADTAASPPTRTKSSISVVTKRTFTASSLPEPSMLLCKIGSNFHYLRCARRGEGDWRKAFLQGALKLGSRRAPGRRRGGSVNDHDHRRAG